MAKRPGRASGAQAAARGKEISDLAGGADHAVRIDMSTLAATGGYLLRRAQLAFFEDFIKSFAPLGLRPAQFSVLAIVEKNPGLKQSEIAHTLGIQRTNFVAMMDELESRGLAVREPSQSDRRSYAVALTNEGRALMRRAMTILAEHEARMLRRLTPDDQTEMMRLLVLLTGE